MSAMPKSADAIERWINSLCNPAPAKPAKPAANAAPKPKPKAIAKPKPKASTAVNITPPSSSSQSQQVTFTPNPIQASYHPATVLAIGQLATFSSNPTLHLRTQQLLGRAAEVEFRPVALVWSFSDGGTAQSIDTRKSFAAAGEYQAVATVSYSVRYRILGETGWQQLAGSLSFRSNRLEIQVGASYLGGGQAIAGALLVGADCVGRPKAFGCFD
jgi:hypothetical protein